MHELFIDIETFSPVTLTIAEVYPYSDHDNFELFMVGYSIDCGPVEIIDLTFGDQRLARCWPRWLTITRPSGLQCGFRARLASQGEAYPLSSRTQPVTRTALVGRPQSRNHPHTTMMVGTIMGRRR